MSVVQVQGECVEGRQLNDVIKAIAKRSGERPLWIDFERRQASSKELGLDDAAADAPVSADAPVAEDDLCAPPKKLSPRNSGEVAKPKNLFDDEGNGDTGAATSSAGLFSSPRSAPSFEVCSPSPSLPRLLTSLVHCCSVSITDTGLPSSFLG